MKTMGGASLGRNNQEFRFGHEFKMPFQYPSKVVND